jgi:TrmH family RNA methyltransferase
MSSKIINSRDNALVKRARAVRDGKIRGQIFIEGVRLCEEATRAGLEINAVLYNEKLLKDERGQRLLQSLKAAEAQVALVSESVLSSVSDTKTPQGVVILALRPPTDKSVLEKGAAEIPLIVVMHRINNPSNAGAILRTAEAAGATGAVVTLDSTDIFSPKALRGAMGSSFRLPLWTGADFKEALAWCSRRQIQTIATDASARRVYIEVDWTRPNAFIVGEEGSGLTASEVAEAIEAVKIPMRAPVESLNVAVATGIVLYEAARQRNEKP